MNRSLEQVMSPLWDSSVWCRAQRIYCQHESEQFIHAKSCNLINTQTRYPFPDKLNQRLICREMVFLQYNLKRFTIPAMVA